jgi:hypothetical protein
VFAELPSIHDIAIENKQPWRNGAQISGKFFCPAGVCAQVQIGDDYYFNGTFLHARGFIKLTTACKLSINRGLRECEE